MPFRQFAYFSHNEPCGPARGFLPHVVEVRVDEKEGLAGGEVAETGPSGDARAGAVPADEARAVGVLREPESAAFQHPDARRVVEDGGIFPLRLAIFAAHSDVSVGRQPFQEVGQLPVEHFLHAHDVPGLCPYQGGYGILAHVPAVGPVVGIVVADVERGYPEETVVGGGSPGRQGGGEAVPPDGEKKDKALCSEQKSPRCRQPGGSGLRRRGLYAFCGVHACWSAISLSMAAIFSFRSCSSSFSFSIFLFISFSRLLPFFELQVRKPKLFSYVLISLRLIS